MKHIISLGAGVQSSAMALMAAHGEITPMPEAAVFADLGVEPQAVYDWLDKLETLLPFPVYRVGKGNLMEDQLKWTTSKDGEVKYIRNFIPAFTKAKDGSIGMLIRKCTSEYKIGPIDKKQRELAGLKKGDRCTEVRVISWQGISQDEIQRARVSRNKWMQIRYPLLEQRLTRGHCLEWMRKHYGLGMLPPKSACICCPYHSNAQWKKLTADEFARVVKFEKDWNACVRGDKRSTQVRGEIFLHRQMVPLDQADLTTEADFGQGDMFEEECTGMCGL